MTRLLRVTDISLLYISAIINYIPLLIKIFSSTDRLQYKTMTDHSRASRLSVISGHLKYRGGKPLSKVQCAELKQHDVQPGTRSIPKTREDILKWNGWGYKDSTFIENKDGQMELIVGSKDGHVYAYGLE